MNQRRQACEDCAMKSFVSLSSSVRGCLKRIENLSYTEVLLLNNIIFIMTLFVINNILLKKFNYPYTYFCSINIFKQKISILNVFSHFI